MTNTLNLAWQISEVIPTLPTGEDAKMLYDSLPEQVRVGLRYDEGSQTIIGSTPFASVNLDIEAQKYGARTPNLRDLSRPEVMRIAKDKYYIDSRNLVARSEEDSFSKNNSLLKTICGLVEAKDGTVKFPFMIEVFNFVPNPEDKTGYGLSIVAGPDFNVIQDERFEGKYSGKRFTEVDESGIPLFDKNGTRRWSAKDNGLSKLYLDGDLNLRSLSSYLANSGGSGRVVFLMGAKGAQNSLQKYISELKTAEQEANTHNSRIVAEAIDRLKHN